jgi:vanillate O-demethylase ferredoxin subunit
MDWVLDGAQRAGWASGRLHREYFAAPPAAATTESDGFELVLAATGRRLRFETGETVVEVLHRAGVDLPVSCEQGLCGTCEVAVLEGIPDHRDHFLTPEEKASGRRFLLCCSRSKSTCLVLDL